MFVIIDKIPDNQSVAYIVREKDLDKLNLDKKAFDYVQKKIQEEETLISLNFYTYGIFIQLADEKKSGPGLLE